MHTSATSFPEDIDNRVYYTDIGLQHTDILQAYNELVNDGQYKQASQYLYDNVEVENLNVDYNGAYIWNMFENRLSAIEDYALDMEATDTRGIYGSTEPIGQPKNRVWIS